MATFVLVHGAWRGGWCYRGVARCLRQAGHEVFTPTLTGLGERAHLGALSISLSTHVEDIVSAIVCEEIDNVVLCGHSYGGMVVTGVAGRLPGKIRALVYLDAFVPESGKALWDYISEAEKSYFVSSAAGGGLTAPIPAAAFACTDPAWVDRRCGPHPIACFLEALTLKHPTLPRPQVVRVRRRLGPGRPDPHAVPAILRALPQRRPLDGAHRRHGPRCDGG